MEHDFWILDQKEGICNIEYFVYVVLFVAISHKVSNQEDKINVIFDFREEWDCSSGMMPAITTAATFVMSSAEEIDGELLYGRYGNPSRNSVEAVLASLEGAKHAMCFSSGNNYCSKISFCTYKLGL